jgi:hypothetical protein
VYAVVYAVHSAGLQHFQVKLLHATCQSALPAAFDLLPPPGPQPATLQAVTAQSPCRPGSLGRHQTCSQECQHWGPAAAGSSSQVHHQTVSLKAMRAHDCICSIWSSCNTCVAARLVVKAATHPARTVIVVKTEPWHKLALSGAAVHMAVAVPQSALTVQCCMPHVPPVSARIAGFTWQSSSRCNGLQCQ